MTRNTIVAAIAAAAAWALVACAAAPKQAGTSRAAPDAAGNDAATAEAAVPYSPEVQDISILYAEIRKFRREAGLPADPFDEDVRQFQRLPLSKALVCPESHEPPNDTCRDICDLSNHICDNAEDICRIAGDLPGNVWAEDKCSSAKASCKEAKEKCCGCSDDNAEAQFGGRTDNDRWRTLN